MKGVTHPGLVSFAQAGQFVGFNSGLFKSSAPWSATTADGAAPGAGPPAA
jgi:hypothetical protein